MKYQKSWASCVANMYHVDSNCFTLSSSSEPCTSNWLRSSGSVGRSRVPQVRGTLEEAIEKAVLVVYETHQAYLLCQLDYTYYWSHFHHPILLLKNKKQQK